jgi:hypothetical protein
MEKTAHRIMAIVEELDAEQQQALLTLLELTVPDDEDDPADD